MPVHIFFKIRATPIYLLTMSTELPPAQEQSAEVAANEPQSIEDAIKYLASFSQLTSKTLCDLQTSVTNLAAIVENQAKELTNLRELINTGDRSNDDLPRPNDIQNDRDDGDRDKEYIALLNKMQMRRAALAEFLPEPENKKESPAIVNAKAAIIAAARLSVKDNQ